MHNSETIERKTQTHIQFEINTRQTKPTTEKRIEKKKNNNNNLYMPSTTNKSRAHVANRCEYWYWQNLLQLLHLSSRLILCCSLVCAVCPCMFCVCGIFVFCFQWPNSARNGTEKIISKQTPSFLHFRCRWNSTRR